MYYANVAQIGDRIRALDFEPLSGRPLCFIEGTVVAKGMTDRGYLAYTIQVTRDVYLEEDVDTRVGAMSYVPFGLVMGDYEGRVAKI